MTASNHNQGKQGIIQRMAEFKDMYRVVRFACELNVDKLASLRAENEGLTAIKIASLLTITYPSLTVYKKRAERSISCSSK